MDDGISMRLFYAEDRSDSVERIAPRFAYFRLWVSQSLPLLDWTGRTLAPGKRGRIAQNAPAIISIIDRNPVYWTTRVAAYGNGWARAAGSAQHLIALAERIGQRWLRGLRLAAKLG